MHFFMQKEYFSVSSSKHSFYGKWGRKTRQFLIRVVYKLRMYYLIVEYRNSWKIHLLFDFLLGMVSSLIFAGSGRVGFWKCELGSGRV